MSNSSFREDCLKGRIVLITGGAGAIGLSVVESLKAHGAKVAVSDIIEEADVNQSLELDSSVQYFQADVSDEESVSRLFDSVEAVFGVPDIVCCHAGIVVSSPYLEYPLSDFERVMNVNLKGAFLVSREGARRLVGKCSPDRPGRILFTSSWVQDVPWPEIAAYSASKSGLKLLMRTLAREVCEQHILVNSIAPGIVAAGMAKHQWDTDPDYQRRAKKAIPLGYMQPTETVSDAFVFLCSDASRYMTGATLLVDGGCSLYPMDD